MEGMQPRYISEYSGNFLSDSKHLVKTMHYLELDGHKKEYDQNIENQIIFCMPYLLTLVDLLPCYDR